MYLQTPRLQYNLQGVGVFQKAHSDKNIQAEACRNIIPQKCEQFKQKAYIRTPKEVWTIGFQDCLVSCIVSSTSAPKEIGSNKQRKKISENGTKVPKGIDKLS